MKDKTKKKMKYERIKSGRTKFTEIMKYPDASTSSPPPPPNKTHNPRLLFLNDFCLNNL